LIFGAAVSASFAGMERTRKNYLIFCCFFTAIFVLQVTCLLTLGMEITLSIYPLISHLPIIIFLVVYLKRPWLISITCSLTSYLCCQLPRWIGAISGQVFNYGTADHLGYMLSAVLMYNILSKYVVDLARYLMERSVKSCLLFAAMPAFYYLFDYSTTYYADFIYSKARGTALILPFITAAFYFLFVLLYYAETQKQAMMQRERDMLDAQLKQAQMEFASLRQLQQSAATYRHDMRHHVAHLQLLASEERMDEIKEYLRSAQSDLDSITPKRFCENDTVNLILSSFAAKAAQSEILLTAEVNLPESLPFSDTELCSLLSNALENALKATESVLNKSQRQIKLRMYTKNNKLFLDIRNRYQTEPVFKNGMPVTKKQGHGFGAKSMVHIVENHSGICRFSIQDNWFTFQATV